MTRTVPAYRLIIQLSDPPDNMGNPIHLAVPAGLAREEALRRIVAAIAEEIGTMPMAD